MSPPQQSLLLILRFEVSLVESDFSHVTSHFRTYLNLGLIFDWFILAHKNALIILVLYVWVCPAETF